MIARFFKKKASPAPARPTTARKAIAAEKPKAPTKAVHQKVLTAEGWRRMMMRTRKGKKG